MRMHTCKHTRALSCSPPHAPTGRGQVHYGVPEGSYSTQPDGPLRVLEYREMVQVGGKEVGAHVE